MYSEDVSRRKHSHARHLLSRVYFLLGTGTRAWLVAGSLVASRTLCVRCVRALCMYRLQFHTVDNEVEKNRVQAAGGWFSADGRLFGKLQPTRSFGDQDIHRSLSHLLRAQSTCIDDVL